MTSLAWLASVIADHGYAVLFIATLIEGPIATVIGAFIAAQGTLDLGAVFAIAVAGDLVGDIALYAIGRWGRSGTSRIHRFRADWGPSLDALLARFRARPGTTLLVGKLTHAAGFLVLIAAGAAGVSVAKFVGYNLLGTLPKVAVFAAIGFFAGAAYAQINTVLGLFSLVSFAVVGSAAIYMRKRFFKFGGESP